MIRKLIHLVLTLGIVAGLGYVLWLGLHKHQAMVAASADTENHL